MKNFFIIVVVLALLGGGVFYWYSQSLVPAATQEVSADATFDPSSAKVGDKVGIFTITAIEPGKRITFTGNLGLAGNLTYELGGIDSYFLELSSADASRIPHAQNAIKKVLPIGGDIPQGFAVPGTSIKAKATITQYTYRLSPSDAGSDATVSSLTRL